MNEKRFARMAREKLRLKMRSREGDTRAEYTAGGTAAGRLYSCPTISTEISTAGIVPLFSSQCVVSLSSGQPTPGP